MENTEQPTRPTLICLGGGVESMEIIKYIYNAGYRPVILDYNPQCAAAEWVAQLTAEWKIENKRYNRRLAYHDRASNNGQRYENKKRLPAPSKYPPALFLKANCYNWRSVDLAIRDALRSNRPETLKEKTFFENVVGVICCAVDAPIVQAHTAEWLRLPTIGIEAAKFGAHKHWQNERLASTGVLVPRERAVNPQLAWEDVKDYDIVKPVDSSGARGVRFYTQDNYKEAFAEAMSYSLNEGMIIAQEFIDGMQISTESVIWNGQMVMNAMAQRNYDEALDRFSPYIIEDGSDSPAQIENATIRRGIADAIERSCAALGWNNCTVKSDIVVHPSGAVYVIELAPRLSGGYFASHIIPAAYGWDILGDALSLAVGQPPALNLQREWNYTCQRFIFQKPEWVGRRISNIPCADNTPGEVSSTHGILVGAELLRWNYKPGDIIRPLKAHPDRLGMVLTTGSTAAEAEGLARDIVRWAMEEIKIE